MAHHVIYLPGVGDHKNGKIQKNAIKKWHKFGLDAHLHLIGWNSSEPYKSKLSKAIKIVDELYNQQHTVSLVGASAGASLAMNVYVARKDKISAAVFICGKINNPQTLGEDYRKNYPALLDCVRTSSENVKKLSMEDKQKMLTITPIFDGVVAKDDSIVTGIKNKTIFSIVHGVSILAAITIYKRISINFIKSKTSDLHTAL